NQAFGVFVFLAIFVQPVDQVLPVLISQRGIYEACERPSESYSWLAILGANMFVGAVWDSLYFMVFPSWSLPQRASDWCRAFSRNLAFFSFASSFVHLIIAGMDSHEVGGDVLGLFSIMMFPFCEQVLIIYRVLDFMYFVEGSLGTALANAKATCASNEFLVFNPPGGSTFGEYMQQYMDVAGGLVNNPDALERCRFCPIPETNTSLAKLGIMWPFFIFNTAVVFTLHWLARVPKKPKVKSDRGT
ncbi:multidrug resistance protein cdr1, partial [Colletotrichum incanum]